MLDNSIEKLKSIFRDNIRRQRAQVTQEVAQFAAHSLWVQLQEQSQYQNAKKVAAFVSLGTEINTYPMMQGILDANKELYLPKIEKTKNVIQFHPIKDLKELAPGAFDILEPPASEVLPPEKLDLIIVPGLAFDNRGHRLGYGRGYYDQFLKLIDPKCFVMGAAYSFQIIDKTPNANHDIPVNAVLTDKYILLC